MKSCTLIVVRYKDKSILTSDILWLCYVHRSLNHYKFWEKLWLLGLLGYNVAT